MNLDCSGIYRITNLITNKFYIGSSKNIKNRWNKHLNKLRSNKHHSRYLQHSYNKYCEEVFSILVEEYCNEDILIKREQYYLDLYKPHYNISPSTKCSRGITRSDEYKEKLRQINLGKKQSIDTINKRNITRKFNNKKLTSENRENYAKSKKGLLNPTHKYGWSKQIEAMTKYNTGIKRPLSVGINISKALSIPIVQLDLENNFIKEWESATKVEKELGFANSKINIVCSGKLCKNKLKNGKIVYYSRLTAYGFKWKFKKDYDNKKNNN